MVVFPHPLSGNEALSSRSCDPSVRISQGWKNIPEKEQRKNYGRFCIYFQEISKFNCLFEIINAQYVTDKSGEKYHFKDFQTIGKHKTIK